LLVCETPFGPCILVGEVWKTCSKTSSFGIKGVITLLQFLNVWTQLENRKEQIKLGFFAYFFHHIYVVVCIHVIFVLFSQVEILTKFYITSWVSSKWRGWYLCKSIFRWLNIWQLEDHSKSWIPTLSTLLRSPFYQQGMNKWKIIMFFYRRKMHKDKNTHGHVELKRQCL